MASFTIADLERLTATIEQGSGVDTGQPQNGVNTGHQPPPLERGIERQIYDVLYNRRDWMKRAEVAAELKLKKSDWLIAHMEALVESRHLVKTEVPLRNGMKQFFYAVARS